MFSHVNGCLGGARFVARVLRSPCHTTQPKEMRLDFLGIVEGNIRVLSCTWMLPDGS